MIVMNSQQWLKSLKQCTSLVKKCEMPLETVFISGTLIRMNEELGKRTMELCARSKTSQLWLYYQNMLEVARSLITADRTGSWLMHLRAVSD